MDFRMLNAKLLPQAANLWDYCFEKKGDPFYEWYFSEYCLKQNTVIGGFDDDKLACMLHLNLVPGIAVVGNVHIGECF